MVALAMASCSKDDSTGINKGSAIDFRVALGTRAAETTTSNLTTIFVTAIDKNNANLFSDEEFSKNGQYFTSGDPYYWPNDGSNLSFFAYSPSAMDLGATVTINSTTKTLTDFQPATMIADQKDFVTANATGNKTNEATGVPLTFAHRLAQIEIKAKNTNENYVYKVTGVRIGQPISKASFDFRLDARNRQGQLCSYLHCCKNTDCHCRIAHGSGRRQRDADSAAACRMDSRYG